jgi:hypothetical protein
MTEENKMQNVIDIYNRVDDATGGLAEFAVVTSVGGSLVIGLYCIMAAAFFGYVQLFALITGAL